MHSGEFIGGISAPEVNDEMIKLCEKVFTMWLGGERATLKKVGDKIQISSDGREVLVGKGIAHLCVQKSDGKLLGAQIAVHHGEHLAHHLACAMEQELTVYEMLALYFQHPTLEEGFYALMLNCVKKIGIKKEGILEVPFLS